MYKLVLNHLKGTRNIIEGYKVRETVGRIPKLGGLMRLVFKGSTEKIVRTKSRIPKADYRRYIYPCSLSTNEGSCT